MLCPPSYSLRASQGHLLQASKRGFFGVGAVLVKTIAIYSEMVPLVCLVLGAAQT